jgi:hypothetical protein
MKKPKERVLYEEYYKKGAVRIQKDLLPERLPYMPEGAQIVSMEIRKAGTIEADGERLEFQDIHVRVRMK